MRKLMITTAMALVAASGATAQDVALVLGTENYSEMARVNRADEPTAAIDGLAQLGFDVLQVRDGTAAQVERALDQFVNRVPRAERIVVTLSGRFINDGGRTWYLTADAPVPEYLGLDDTAISVDSIMRVMARSPGDAILILGYDDSDLAVYDSWLSEGFGDLDIPQGVTVLSGGPREVSRFMSNELVQVQGDLARLVAANRTISAAGFLPRQMIFMDMEQPRDDGGAASAAELAAAAERALWSGAVALDTIEAYSNYLDRHPRGAFAAEAISRIDAIRAEPNRQARLAEEALQLPRDERRVVQQNLNILNFDTRGVDGIWGAGTRTAVRNWQQQNGFAQTGFLNMDQIRRIANQASRRQEELDTINAERSLEERRAENAFWEQSGALGTVRGFQAYLDRYPNGRYVGIARERMAVALQASDDELALEEAALWQNTQRQGDIAAYENYLRQYPTGQHIEEARARLAGLRALPQTGTGGGAIADQFLQAERALGLNNLTRRLVENHLQSLGMNPGAADGEFDAQARQAIRRYQNERGLQVTGYLDARTAAMMLSEAQ